MSRWKAGPPKKPTALKILEGNPGNRPLPANEPKPKKPIGVPDPPKDKGIHLLDRVGRGEWIRIAEYMHDVGLLTYLDYGTLLAYCESYSLYLKAVGELKKGLMIMTGKGIKENPYFRIRNQAIKNMKEYGRELGLSPAARASIEVKPEDKPKNRDEDLLT